MATKKAEIKSSITMDDSSFQRGLRRAQNSAERFASRVDKSLSLGGVMKRAGGALAAAFAAQSVKEGLRGAYNAGERLKDLNTIAGISVRSLSKLSDMFETAGVPVDQLEKSVAKMQKTIFQVATTGSGKLDPVLKKMNVRFEDLVKMSPEEQFIGLGKAIKGLPTQLERVGAATAFFGKTGADLLEVFEDFDTLDMGSLDKRAAFFERNAAAFDKLNSNVRKAKISMQDFWLGLAEKLLPTIQSIAETIQKIDWEKLGGSVAKGPVGMGSDAGQAAREYIKGGGMLRDVGSGLSGFMGGVVAKSILPRDRFGRPVRNPNNLSNGSATTPPMIPSTTGGIDAFKARGVNASLPPLEHTGPLLSGVKGSLRELTEPTTEPGGIGLRRGLSEIPAKRMGSLLSKKERDAINDKIVADGGTRQGSTPGAFNAYRMGDAKRRKEAAKNAEIEKLTGKESGDKILKQIADAVKTIAGGGGND